jgi:negative regulator of replication initiation
MEIQAQLLNVKTNGSNQSVRLRQGDIYSAKITSRISSTEAMVSIRGQEVKATFDGKVPDRDRVAVQVQEQTKDGIKVREVKEENKQSNEGNKTTPRNGNGQSADRVLRDMGFKEPSKELRQATQQLLDRGVSLNRESVNDLNNYLQSGRGSEGERRQTVQTMAQKRLEPTAGQIRAVHEALHGRSTADHVKDLTRSASDQLRGSVSDRDVSREVQRAIERLRTSLMTGTNVRQAVEHLQQTVEQSGGVSLKKEINQALREMLQIQAVNGREAAAERIMMLLQQVTNQTTDTISTVTQPIASNTSEPISQSFLTQWIASVQNTADLSAVIANIKQEVSQAAGGLPVQTTEQLTTALNDAMARLDQGRELKARQVLMDTFQHLQATQSTPPASDSLAHMQDYMRNEIIQTSGLSSKHILITEVTEKLAQATDNFKLLQKDVVKQLSRIDTMIQQFKSQSTQQTRPMLENVIKQMDRAIMKSDWMLYADMKTERSMLGASSRLAEAKHLLSKGQYTEARQIVKEVQRTMDQINFRPSNQRVQHVLSQEQEWREPRTPVHRLSQQFEQTARQFVTQEGSARHVFEGLRGLGLNRETELGQMLASGRDLSQQDQHQRNVKSILMQMTRGEEEGGRQQQQAQQALQSLSGQQLINRSDSQQNLQMLQLSIPVMLKGEAENLQVYVNSRNEGDQVDWENCQLYFHIDTKKLGPLGIVLQVTDRSLNVTLKNDTDGFAHKIEPLATSYLENLKEVGFNVKTIQSAPMTTVVDEIQEAGEEVAEEKPALPVMTEEGFDYKV